MSTNIDKRKEKSRKKTDGLNAKKRLYAEYLQNRKKYSLPFEAYEVHHRDFNKANRDASNLRLLTPREHDLLHYVHKEEIRRKAEKREEKLENIKKIQKEKKKKKGRKIIFILFAILVIGALIFFLFPKSSSSKTGVKSVGFITIGNSEISTQEEVDRVCNITCEGSLKYTTPNFQKHFAMCFCLHEKHYFDTKTLENLSLEDIKRRLF